MSVSLELQPHLYDPKKIELAHIRDGFGHGLVKAADANDQIVALCADLTESTRMNYFQEKFPERYIEVGVAEQNLVTLASGMAAIGKIPFVASYATFSPGRNWEQIRTTICYNNRPVVIVGAHAGVSVGPDGATHQALEDIALMRVLPNMTVIVPCDMHQAYQATIAAASYGKPAYLRLARDKSPLITTEKTGFEIGKAQVLREGSDIVIISCGIVTHGALIAAEQLEKKHKISVGVVNMHTIKPLDEQLIVAIAKQARFLVTVEEHQVRGGLGSAVSECVTSTRPMPVLRLGIRDRFGESGNPTELLKHFELDADGIVAAVSQALTHV